jgi:hypothetical protein
MALLQSSGSRAAAPAAAQMDQADLKAAEQLAEIYRKMSE